MSSRSRTKKLLSLVLNNDTNTGKAVETDTDVAVNNNVEVVLNNDNIGFGNNLEKQDLISNHSYYDIGTYRII